MDTQNANLKTASPSGDPFRLFIDISLSATFIIILSFFHKSHILWPPKNMHYIDGTSMLRVKQLSVMTTWKSVISNYELIWKGSVVYVRYNFQSNQYFFRHKLTRLF
jgi:hypothetical protein